LEKNKTNMNEIKTNMNEIKTNMNANINEIKRIQKKQKI